MHIRYIILLGLVLLLNWNPMSAQEIAPDSRTSAIHTPYLRVGVLAAGGVHRAMGNTKSVIRTELTTVQYTSRPEINAGTQAGLALDIGKTGRHLGLRLTTALSLQHFEWDFDGVSYNRLYGTKQWTAKISETNLAVDFSLRAVWSSLSKHPFRCAIGAYAGTGVLNRSRSYLKLEPGNFIQAYQINVPAGIVLQCSKQYAAKGWRLEPFLEARNSFNYISTFPNMWMLGMQAGLIAWLPNWNN